MATIALHLVGDLARDRRDKGVMTLVTTIRRHKWLFSMRLGRATDRHDNVGTETPRCATSLKRTNLGGPN
jgi:hypothetical protein